MNTALIPFAFETIKLKESCWIEDKPYFTRRAIGEWLEYAKPQEAIDTLITRNPHIDQFSVHLNLRCTDGKEYDQRCYDPIGLQLIIFESHQPRAKEYKAVVAHLVVAFMRGELSQNPQYRPVNSLEDPNIKTFLVEVLQDKTIPLGQYAGLLESRITYLESRPRGMPSRLIQQLGQEVLQAQISDLRNQGYSYRQIGAMFGKSGQWVHYHDNKDHVLKVSKHPVSNWADKTVPLKPLIVRKKRS